jgi:hypothetical protein
MKTAKQLQAKKAWSTPELTNHGTVESLTQAPPKSKNFGPQDDFATTPSLTTV